MSKRAALLLIVILTVSSLIVVKAACAQVGVTSPSMPEFGIRYETYTIYMPPTYGVDASTGKAVITKTGYNEVNRWVDVDILNQPFTPYNDSNGNPIHLFYGVRWKGHLDSDNSWKGIPDGIWTTQLSDSDYTDIIVGFRGYNGSEGYMALLDYIPGSQIDFQVKASIGYYTADNVFIGKTSGWSNTQTLTIPTSTPSPTSSPSLTSPNQTIEPITNENSQTLQLEAIIGTVLAVVLLSVGLLVYFKKHKR
jgi:hypothetical protein